MEKQMIIISGCHWLNELDMTEFRNIADQQLKENRMKQIEEMQASISHIGNLKNDSLLLSITDKNGTIDYANKKFCEVSGYTEKEIIGQNHRILKSGFHPPEFYKDLWDTISRGQVWHGEIKNLNKNGKHYWVKTTIVPFLDKNGIPEQYIAIRADITEQKENEQLMQEIIKKQIEEMETSTIRLANLKNALDESSLVSITDKNGTIDYANKKFCEVSGYTEKEIIGQNHRILKSGFHPPEFYKDLWDTISRGQVWHGEIKNLNKNGKHYWVKTTIVPFLDKNGVLEQYIAIRADITEQKEMRDNILKMEKLSAIGELSARIAHDIRNPLSVIKNSFEILQYKNKELTNYDKEDFERIDRAVRRITHQIEDVLDYVRPKSLVLAEKKINAIIQDSLEECVIPKSVVVNVSSDDITLLCDAEKLGIVFTNLIINAVQAMGKTGTIDISCRGDEKNITIKIHDTGAGIPDDFIPRIFDPLFTAKQVGTGLGLSSCKSIVEKHRGKIEVESQLGKGTTFIITLPKNG